jgi:hypothetical protein
MGLTESGPTTFFTCLGICTRTLIIIAQESQMKIFRTR